MVARSNNFSLIFGVLKRKKEGSYWNINSADAFWLTVANPACSVRVCIHGSVVSASKKIR
jgi:hypothetical protein